MFSRLPILFVWKVGVGNVVGKAVQYYILQPSMYCIRSSGNPYVHSHQGNLPWFRFYYVQVGQPVRLVIDSVFKVGYFVLAFQFLCPNSVRSLTSLQALDSFLSLTGKEVTKQVKLKWNCTRLFSFLSSCTSVLLILVSGTGTSSSLAASLC